MEVPCLGEPHPTHVKEPTALTKTSRGPSRFKPYSLVSGVSTVSTQERALHDGYDRFPIRTDTVRTVNSALLCNTDLSVIKQTIPQNTDKTFLFVTLGGKPRENEGGYSAPSGRLSRRAILSFCSLKKPEKFVPGLCMQLFGFPLHFAEQTLENER
ncbi:hypothetical protein Bbelb_093650 [Branchiostoma belcheri]|nr:hypothetical protein Bbelb_093650 [Branchiostoma belcheri]